MSLSIGTVLLCVQSFISTGFFDQEVVKSEGFHAVVQELGDYPKSMIYVDFTDSFRERAVMKHPLNYRKRWVFRSACYEDPNLSGRASQDLSIFGGSK